MLARLLKQGMPRSLQGRTTLILLVPVITMLIVLSIIVVQRLYDGVARRMTEEVARQVEFVLSAADRAGAARALGITMVDQPPPRGVKRTWDDLSGRSIAAAFAAEIEGLTGVDLESDDRSALIGVARAGEEVTLRVARSRLAARNPHQFLIVLGVTAVLMTAIAWVYLRGQVRPIKRLAVAAEAFGKGRSISYRPAGATEVRAAGGAFLEMRERIERQTRQRTEFLSGVSHDLRTPLTRLRLSLSMLDDAETTEMIRDVDEMERMLDAFLAFARSEAEETFVPVEPAELVREAVAKARRAGIEVKEGRIDEGGPVRLAPQTVARALGNLLANAGRYAGQAEVSLRLTEGEVRIDVEDDGPGIPAEARADALRPFVRLDTARNQDAGAGTGLGLAIAEDAVRRHGGRLELDDGARLGGLRATLILPR